MKKLFVVIGVLTLALGLSYWYVDAGSSKSYDEEFPVKDIKVVPTAEMIEHGRYLVYGPAHCAHCHSGIENLAQLEAGEEIPLTGGFKFELEIGNIYTPNLTPDPTTGIGRYSDGQIYRMLRHNIRPDGQVCIDFMPFYNMTEEDIFSIIAFLRSRDPIMKPREENQYNLQGKVVRTFSLRPFKPKGVLEQSIERNNSLAYGQYLVESVANCMGCHTDRNMNTGEYIGEPYAGGFQIGPDGRTNQWTFVTPNLTPDEKTGIIANWDEETFIDRMRGGRVHQYSPMPWGPFSRLENSDLKAIYKYLRTLKPVEKENPPAVTPPA